jgi:hypothetical protein
MRRHGLVRSYNMTAMAMVSKGHASPEAAYDLSQYVLPQADGSIGRVVVALSPESEAPGCVRRFDEWELHVTLDGQQLPVSSSPSVRGAWQIERLLNGDEIGRLELCAVPLDAGEMIG